MSLLINKFNNSYVTKWHIVANEAHDAMIYTASRIDRSGMLKLYGVYDSTTELEYTMNEEEEPFSVEVKETIRNRRQGVLPMDVLVTKEQYELGYCTCLSWHLEEFDIPNNITITMMRCGLSMTYGTLASKVRAERIYKSVVRLYKKHDSVALAGSLYTDDWSEVEYEIKKRGCGLIDGPMELSYIHQDDDGFWCSWGLKETTIINLMLALVDLGGVRHQTSIMYRCCVGENRLGRLTKGTRGKVRTAVFTTCGKGIVERYEEGRPNMARMSARYNAKDGSDAFNSEIVPNSFKSTVDGLHYTDRNKKEFST